VCVSKSAAAREYHLPVPNRGRRAAVLSLVRGLGFRVRIVSDSGIVGRLFERRHKMRHKSSQPCPPAARPSTQSGLSLASPAVEGERHRLEGGLGLFRFVSDRPNSQQSVRAWVGRWYYGVVVAFGET
jgi:hypothetical protein